MTNTDPRNVPGRRDCCYSMPDGIASGEYAKIDQLHIDAGQLAWTYEQHVAEMAQLEMPALDELTWQRRRLANLTRLRASFETAEAEIVRDARRAGMTWDGVGQALGVTRQAAQMRFGK